jgi:hypothetical protein
MKLAAAGLLIAAVGLSGTAHADGLQAAFTAVSTSFQPHGGGLAPLYTACPKSNNDNWQYLGSAVFVAIGQTDSAVLVNTGWCNGG